MTRDEAKDVYKYGRKMQELYYKMLIPFDDIKVHSNDLPERGKRAFGELQDIMYQQLDAIRGILGSLDDEFGPGLDEE